MSSVERSIDDVKYEVAGLKNAVKEIAEILKQQNPTQETKRLEYIQIIGSHYYDTLSEGIDSFMKTLRDIDPGASLVDVNMIKGHGTSFIATIIYRSTSKVDFDPIYNDYNDT